MIRELKCTDDGSFTLFVPSLNEHYHSIHGALQEAKHVFIEHGIHKYKFQKNIRILEVGLGTCLNAYLTYKWAALHKIHVTYVGLEPNPVAFETLKTCLGAVANDDLKSIDFFATLTDDKEKQLGDFFTIVTLKSTLQKYQNPSFFDVIYYDAFGPKAQAEMWEMEVFSIAYKSLKIGGSLVTYCAKGQVKRDLKATGFEVLTVEGPPGKREMIIAKKL